MTEKEHLERIVKAWEGLFYRDDDKMMWEASEMLGLEGYCLFRLRDAVRGRKSSEYANIEDFKTVDCYESTD